MIFPADNFIGDSPAEEVVWRLAKKAVPKECLCFHNYFLETKRPDIILLTPHKGILIIEIKGFLAKNIKSIPDSTIIKFVNSPAKGSPFNQAINYRNKLIEMMGKNHDINPAFVSVAVCYPHINQEDFKEKKLFKISRKEMTILEEDMANETTFWDKIEEIYQFVYESMQMKFDLIQLDGDALKKIAYLFAPDFDVDIDINEKEKLELTKEVVNAGYYSKVITFPKKADKEALIKLIYEWFAGGKLYVFFGDEQDYDWFFSTLKEKLIEEGKSVFEPFEIVRESMPNLVFSYIYGLQSQIEIVNACDFEQYDDILTIIDDGCIFNYQQYKVEHAESEDIIVRAGAGTGKTFSMLSRIDYLIWKHQYDARELVEKIAMITFTNEAAREMKDKLANNFYEKFILTTNVIYLEYMEAVENMRISTIDSMAKEILKKNAVKLGLGTNFSISGGKYDKYKKIHMALTDYISDAGDVDVGMPLHQLEKRIESFVEQIDNKNVDLTTENKVDFGVEEAMGSRIRFIDLLPTIRKAKIEYRNACSKDNKVALSDLIFQLDNLADAMIGQQKSIDYLFVDEFQDTDDVQIRLIVKFKKIYAMKLFVVGDTKQCIYRFRGAYDAAFKLLCKETGTELYEIELKKNYRTDKLLLNRMNKLFVAWNDVGYIDYSERDRLVGTREYNTFDNYFRRHFISDNERDDQIIDEIRRIQKEHQNDSIAILVRTNFQALNIKSLSEKKGIRIETSAGGNLFKIEPALDLLKLLHALKYNQSSKNIYGLYTTAYIAEMLDKVEVDNLPSENKLDYFKNKIPKSLKKWDLYIERLRLEPVLKVVRDIIDDAKPWSIFASKLGGSDEEKKANQQYYLNNLDQIFESISLSSNSNYLTMNSLIENLEIMILTKQEEDEREGTIKNNSISIPICTTVHKAKGLEFDHVILPYCTYDVGGSKEKGDVDILYVGNKVGYSIRGEDYYDRRFVNNYYKEFKENEYEDRKKEEIRILYVAMTRAKKSLVYFISEKEKKSQTIMNWNDMLNFGE